MSELTKDVTRRILETEKWYEQRIADLVCAIWQCPPDERDEHKHADTVAEADRQAKRIAELEESVRQYANRCETGTFDEQNAAFRKLMSVFGLEKAPRLWRRGVRQ